MGNIGYVCGCFLSVLHPGGLKRSPRPAPQCAFTFAYWLETGTKFDCFYKGRFHHHLYKMAFLIKRSFVYKMVYQTKKMGPRDETLKPFALLSGSTRDRTKDPLLVRQML
jgi:hypothetical protein